MDGIRMKNPQEKTFKLSQDTLDLLKTLSLDDAEKITGGGIIFVPVGGGIKIDNDPPVYDDLNRIAIDFTSAG